MNINIKELSNCKICNSSKIEEVLNLGEIYPSNFVTSSEGYTKAPLILVQFINCGLVQLQHTVTPDDMYRQYWYKSNLNKSMVRDLRNIVENIERRVHLDDNDIVVDIGCNDGTLFDFYTNRNMKRVGFDPALNLAEKAKEHCTDFVNDYFAHYLYPYSKRTKVITSIAMFYDLENPNKFISNIQNILTQDGIWVVQMTDLLSMFKVNAFDNICHEHLLYPTLRDMINLTRQNGLEVFEVDYNYVNGGSIRLYIGWKGMHPVLPSVLDSLEREQYYFSQFTYTHPNMPVFKSTFSYFNNKISMVKYITMDYLKDKKKYGQKIYGLGASTKGNTLLQLFNITPDLLPYIVEVNSDKFGLKTIGTEIPIIPDYDIDEVVLTYFVLPWHFMSNLVSRYDRFLEMGGKFFAPLPNVPREVYKDDDTIVYSTV